MASDVRTPCDLEDRRPLTTLAANVLRNARGARAPHIDGTAKLSNKHLRGPRSTDAQKLESMFTTIDRIDATFSLAEDLRQYLLSVCSKSDSSQSSLQPEINALAFMGSESKVQMVRLCSLTNNTSAKKRGFPQQTYQDRKMEGQERSDAAPSICIFQPKEDAPSIN